MPNPLSMPISIIAFIGALIIYALFGTPTPDTPHIVEAVIATCLIITIGAPGVRAIYATEGQNKILFAAQVLLLYGLSVPLIFALARGHDLRLIIRDIVPFLFLLLPLFLSRRISDLNARRITLCGVIAIGVCFAARAGLNGVNFAVALLNITPHAELTYLANSPTILFTCIFLIGTSIDRFIRANKISDGGAIIITTAVGGVCLLPMIMTVQRASLGYMACAMSAIIALYVHARPRRMSLLICALAVGIYMIHQDIGRIVYDAAQKTTLVGFNSRFEELAAVWDTIAQSPLSVIFGAGWGASYHSPAVGGLEVNFTHSLITSMILKTGLIGAMLCAAYIAVIARRVFINASCAPIFALASFGALIIPCFLYASYKSLDFGLLLLLITVYLPKIETTAPLR